MRTVADGEAQPTDTIEAGRDRRVRFEEAIVRSDVGAREVDTETHKIDIGAESTEKQQDRTAAPSMTEATPDC